MNATSQRVCAWCGPATILVFLIGFLLMAGLVPPPSPAATAEEIARLYQENQLRIRLGLFVCLLGSALVYPWTAAISVRLKRIEGESSPLTYAQFLAGMTTGLLFALPFMVMAAAAFRAERSAEGVLLLNDLAWLPLVGIGSPAIVQCLVIAIAVLRDRRAEPVLPRWVAYFNIWCAVLFFPGTTIIFFQTGPFAWNGLFAFYVPLTVFTAWFLVMAWALLGSVSREERSADPDPDPDPSRADQVGAA